MHERQLQEWQLREAQRAPLRRPAAAVKVASGLVDTATEWVPESVPRPVAKGGVAVVGGLIVFSLVQKVRARRGAAAGGLRAAAAGWGAVRGVARGA
jgi:hypothetical protein